MSSERWMLVEELFHCVLDCPPVERRAFLERACGSDLELRGEIESLLAANQEAGSFLSREELHNRIAELDTVQPVGSALGPYRILGPIGSGSMGEVYLASDTRLDRQIALKLLPSRFTRDPERVARFIQEAKAASGLNHPNIITIHEIGQSEGTWFIATEFIEGKTLRERMNAGRLSFKEAVDLAGQVAVALETAHQAGVVHRDVKPENLMLRPDGLVKVVDFGLARIGGADLEAGAGTTLTGSVIGTPRYMSPEQARGERLDARTDIFSLGAVLYELLTGRPAFPGATMAEVFANLLSAEPKPISEIAPEAPRALQSIVSKALQKDCQLRFASMQEFSSALMHSRQQGYSVPALEAGVANQASRPKRRPILWIAATVLLGVMGLAGYKSSASPGRGTTNIAPLTVVPLTSFAGYKDYGSISPDGTRIAFSWTGGREGSAGNPQRDIYVKPIGAGEPIQLTSTGEDDVFPAWSPDGRSIAFCRWLPEGRGYDGVYVVPSTGGPERRVAEGGGGVSWSPDGKTLAIAKLSWKFESGGIFLLNLETGNRRELTAPEPATDRVPVFSPNGKWIAFNRAITEKVREIFVIPVSGGAARQLTSDAKPKSGLTWTADSREVAYSTFRASGGDGLWRVSIAGGAARRISDTMDGAGNPSISRRGDRLLYTSSLVDLNIYRSEGPGFATDGEPGRFGPPKGVILSSREDHSPSFSPDGDRIAFISTRSGNSEIWVARADGGNVTQLTSFKDSPVEGARWSPNGQWLAFSSVAGGSPDIYVIAAAGGTPRRLTTEPSGEGLPFWSPDGLWIYFASDRGGSTQFWKMPAEGGTATQITQGGVGEGWAAEDGRLYYTKRLGGSEIWSVPANGGAEQPVSELPYRNIRRNWGVVKEGIYFLSREAAPHQTIRFFNFRTRRISSLATLDKEPNGWVPMLALSPDGRSLLTVRADQEINDLMLIENFR